MDLVARQLGINPILCPRCSGISDYESMPIIQPGTPEEEVRACRACEQPIGFVAGRMLLLAESPDDALIALARAYSELPAQQKFVADIFKELGRRRVYEMDGCMILTETEIEFIVNVGQYVSDDNRFPPRYLQREYRTFKTRAAYDAFIPKLGRLLGRLPGDYNDDYDEKDPERVGEIEFDEVPAPS